MSDTFPVSLSGPACSSGTMTATVTGAAATVATTMPTTVSVPAAVPAAVAATVPTAVSAAVSAAATTTTAFRVGDVVSNDEAVLAEFHGLRHPGAHDRDGQGRPGQPFGERTPRSGPVAWRLGFDLHGCFSWGVADSF